MLKQTMPTPFKEQSEAQKFADIKNRRDKDGLRYRVENYGSKYRGDTYYVAVFDENDFFLGFV